MGDAYGNITGMQSIDAEGNKKFTAGSKISGSFHVLGCSLKDLMSKPKIYIMEGTMNACTVNQCTGETCVIAFTASNLTKVADALKEAGYRGEIEFIADNDELKKDGTPKEPGAVNAGLNAVLEYSRKHGHYIRTVKRFKYSASNISDINDVYCDAIRRGESEEKAAEGILGIISGRNSALTIAPTRPDHKFFEAVLKNKGHIQSYKDKALTGFMMHFVMRLHSEEEVLQEVRKIRPDISDNMLKKCYNRIMFIKTIEFKKISGVTGKIQGVNYQKIRAKKEDHGGYSLDTVMVPTVKEKEGIKALTAPPGTGKTKLTKLLTDGKHVLYLTHRRALSEDLAEKLGLKNYARVCDMEKSFPLHSGDKGMVLVANSIPKFLNTAILSGIDTIVIEEWSKLRECLTNSTIKDTGIPQAFFDLINQAKHVYITDADFSDDDIRMFQKRSQHPISIYKTEADQSARKFSLCQHEETMQTILKAAENGENVMIGTDNKMDAHMMEQRLIEIYGDPNAVLKIYGDNKEGKRQEEFLGDPNKHLKKYKAVIHTPAIDSALSITVKHFEKHFMLIKGVVEPTTILQMGLRDRTGCHVKVGLDDRASHSVKNRLVQAANFVEANYAAQKAAGLENARRKELTFYDELKLENLRISKEWHTGYAFKLLELIKLRGYSWTVSKLLRKKPREISEEMQALQDSIKEREQEKVAKAEALTDAQYEALKDRFHHTEEEKNQLKQFEIKREMGKSCKATITTGDIEKYDDDFSIHIENFEAHQDPEKARRYTEYEDENVSDLTKKKNLSARTAEYNELYNALGLNRETGEGKFKGLGIKKYYTDLVQDEDRLKAFNGSGIGYQINPHRPPRDMGKFVANIFETQGLNVVECQAEDGSRYYRLCLDKFSEMMKFKADRKKIDVHSAKIPTLKASFVAEKNPEVEQKLDVFKEERPKTAKEKWGPLCDFDNPYNRYVSGCL